MAKEKLKGRIKKKQNGECALSGDPLPERSSLFDTDRINPKANGGIYTDENTRVVDPIAHMKRHNNYRVREEDLLILKARVDDREQVLKFRNKLANQLRALDRRTDDLLEETIEFLNKELAEAEEVLKDRTKRVEAWIKEHKDKDPLIVSALGVKGVGPMTVAYCYCYIDLSKAQYPSSLWKYTGLDRPSHDRYSKGETSGGNKKLRCALWNMAESQVKTGGAYRQDYDNRKAKQSANKEKVKSYNTQGKLIKCAWKDTKPSHRHGDAERKIMKLFLAHWWVVGRKLLGLPTRDEYVREKLGHTNIILPADRGWKFKRKLYVVK